MDDTQYRHLVESYSPEAQPARRQSKRLSWTSPLVQTPGGRRDAKIRILHSMVCATPKFVKIRARSGNAVANDSGWTWVGQALSNLGRNRAKHGRASRRAVFASSTQSELGQGPRSTDPTQGRVPQKPAHMDNIGGPRQHLSEVGINSPMPAKFGELRCCPEVAANKISNKCRTLARGSEGRGPSSANVGRRWPTWANFCQSRVGRVGVAYGGHLVGNFGGTLLFRP